LDCWTPGSADINDSSRIFVLAQRSFLAAAVAIPALPAALDAVVVITEVTVARGVRHLKELD
uniref:Cation transporter n=1 Tax=Gongylonema pulchrum TaxID=637853 RepID=A0A183EXU8_9BILA